MIVLKNFTKCELFCKMFFSIFMNLPQGNFLYCPWFFILTKNLNTARSPTTPVALKI